MNVADLLIALHHEAQCRAYIGRLVVLDQSLSLLKARLYIAIRPPTLKPMTPAQRDVNQ